MIRTTPSRWRSSSACSTLAHTTAATAVSACTSAPGWTYNRVVDELRYDLVLEYLEEDSLSISEIAFLLGYSEISAFDRAFRKRSHLAPLAFRRQLRTG